MRHSFICISFIYLSNKLSQKILISLFKKKKKFGFLTKKDLLPNEKEENKIKVQTSKQKITFCCRKQNKKKSIMKSLRYHCHLSALSKRRERF